MKYSFLILIGVIVFFAFFGFVRPVLAGCGAGPDCTAPGASCVVNGGGCICSVNPGPACPAGGGGGTTGACTLPSDGSCQSMSQADCASSGGSYAGNGSSCSGAGGGTTAPAGFGITLPNPLCLGVPGSASCITTFDGVVSAITNFVTGLIAGLAVIILIWAGLLFVTSAGDPGKVGKAKQAAIYAIIGIAVALAGQGIVMVIRAVLTVP